MALGGKRFACQVDMCSNKGMGRISRKFKYDKSLGKVVEITPDGVKEQCDELSASVQPYLQPVEYKLGKGGKHKNVSGQWPIVSMAAATDPENIPVEQELLRQHGVYTEYTPTGEPIFRDRAHRKAHCEVVGLYDMDAGYGDPTPKYFTSDYAVNGMRR